MKKMISIFDIGYKELLLAFYPILSLYNYGGVFNTGLLCLTILIFCTLIQQLFTKKLNVLRFKPLLLFAFFYVFHQFIYFFIIPNVHIQYLTSIIGFVIGIVAIYLLAPVLNYNKLKNSLYIVAIISFCGLIYHIKQLLSGQGVSPILLPFLPEPNYDDYRFIDGIRPVSFFIEPQALVSFMLVPFFLSLISQDYFITTIIFVSLMMSTSTTGLLASVLMILFFMLTQRVSVKTKIMFSLLMTILIIFMINSEIFQFGLEKLQNTDSSNIRLSNGPSLVAITPISELILGIPGENILSYYGSGVSAKGVEVEQNGDYYFIYVPAFWNVLITLGICGLFLFLRVFYKISKINHITIPFILTIFITFFGVSTTINPLDITVIFSLLIYLDKKNNIDSNLFKTYLVRI